MATRAISWIRKSSLTNALRHASFSLHSSFSTLKHGQSSPPPSFWVSPRAVTSPATSASKKEPLAFSITHPKSLLYPTHPHHGSSGKATQLSQQSLSYSSTAGVYANVSMRFSKQCRNRGEMKGASGNRICFGKYGLQALEPAWITSRQILAGQLAIKRTVRGGKSFIRIFPHKPVSLKPAETRMGRGKGSTAFWVAGVRPGRILYELNGVPENIARRAILVAASKMPIRTQFVKS